MVSVGHYHNMKKSGVTDWRCTRVHVKSVTPRLMFAGFPADCLVADELHLFSGISNGHGARQEHKRLEFGTSDPMDWIPINIANHVHANFQDGSPFCR